MNLMTSSWGQRLYRQLSLMLANQPKLSYYLQPLLRWNTPQLHPDYHAAAVVDYGWETEHILNVWLQPASSWAGFVPGQHLLVTLLHQGRYISRSFSISSSVALFRQQRQIRISCRVQPKGEFTRALAAGISQLKYLSISEAMGDFVLGAEPQISEQPVVMVAAGSGITPLWSMLSSLRCWTGQIQLFYCVKQAAEAAFLAELKLLAAKQPLFELELIETSSQGRLDLVQRLKSNAKFPVQQAQYYLCGPAAMIRQYTQDLLQHGVESTAIQAELFAPDISPAEGAAKQVLVSRQGQLTRIEAGPQTPLLLVAEQHGLNPLFGCRIGVCYQCVCQKTSGRVLNLRTGQLSAEGPEQIQLCISAAHSDLQIEL